MENSEKQQVPRRWSGWSGLPVLLLVACSGESIVPPLPDGYGEGMSEGEMMASNETPPVETTEQDTPEPIATMVPAQEPSEPLPMTATPTTQPDDVEAIPPALPAPGSTPALPPEAEAEEPAEEPTSEPVNLQAPDEPEPEEPVVDEPEEMMEEVPPEENTPPDDAPEVEPPEVEPPTPPVAGNLIQNPGLEQGITGWIVWGGELATTSDPVHSGSAAGVVRNRTEAWHGPVQDVLGEVQGSTSYQASAFATVSGSSSATVTLTLKVTCGGTEDYLNIASATATPGTWAALSGLVQVPSCALEAADLYIEGPAAGVDIYFDDVTLSP